MERRRVKFKTVMTNTVEFTEWSELLNHATNLLRHRIRFLNEDVVSKPDKALGYASCLISFSTTSSFKNSRSILATVP